jgi:dye decolorizing peroxidase
VAGCRACEGRQQHLDRADALNRWTTAIGSAEFAVLPGFRPGGWLGQGLFADRV